MRPVLAILFATAALASACTESEQAASISETNATEDATESQSTGDASDPSGDTSPGADISAEGEFPDTASGGSEDDSSTSQPLLDTTSPANDTAAPESDTESEAIASDAEDAESTPLADVSSLQDAQTIDDMESTQDSGLSTLNDSDEEADSLTADTEANVDAASEPSDMTGPDSEDNDAASVAVDAGTSEEEDVDEGPVWLDTCPATLALMSPSLESFHLVTMPLEVSATLSGDDALQDLLIRWETEAGELLGQTSVLPDGTSAGELDTSQIPIGMTTLVARIESPVGLCMESVEVDIILCQHHVDDDFSALDEASWKMFGSSYWDANGWLEMTGTAQGQRGAVYNPLTDVAAGSVSITFSMATGGGSGADGFAMTIVQTDSIAELENEVIANAVPGSGIGYAVGGVYGPWDGNAFTVEIDTYQNVFNGTNELHTDPTPNDHVAITLDGDAGNHLWWTDMGDVEDLNWRTVRVDVIGFKVRVWIDGVLLVEQVYPELQFRGGYIFFSGSTGYYTNYHRFDDLEVIHTCQ